VSPSSWIVARVGGLREEVPQALQPLAPGADLLPAGQLGGDVGHPQRAARCEQRREAGAVAHHRRVGELAGQRLDLDTVSDGLKVTHRVPPSSPRAGPGARSREGEVGHAVGELPVRWVACWSGQYDDAPPRDVRRRPGRTFWRGVSSDWRGQMAIREVLR
jgi:hypothetical protein